MANSTFHHNTQLEDNSIMNSHAHIALYDALREAGASEEKARAAVADRPIPQNLASKEDLLEAIAGVNDRIAKVEVGVNDRIAAVETKLANLRAEVKTEIAELRGEIRRDLGILKFAYGPIIIALLAKIAFFG